MNRARIGAVNRVGALLVVSALTAASAVGASPSPPACEPGEWMERALAAYRPAGKPPVTFHATSVLVLYGAPGAPPAPREMVELYAFPTRARFEYRTGQTTAVTATDGKRSWRISVDGPVNADDGHFVIPARLRDLGGFLLEARDLGKVECGGGAPVGQQRLLLTLKTGEMVLVDVEASTGLIRRYEGESPGTTGKADVIEVTLDGWHRMDGHWVALELKTKLNGRLASTTSTRSVKVGAEIIEQLFVRPDGLVGPPPTPL